MWRFPAVPAWLKDWLTVVRDLLATGAGFWGVIHEELSKNADLGRMGFFAILMIAPGAIAGYWEMTQQPPATGGSSSPPPEPPSVPPPSSPSSTPSNGSAG